MSESRYSRRRTRAKIEGVMPPFDQCYRASQSRDARFDGWFYLAVTSTGIFCRPSCPARTPHRRHARFFGTAAAAQQAGFRACRRCRPDAVPGSPEWDTRADVVARGMRLIADGVVDRDGVAGLAARVGYTARHLTRQFVAELGVGPLAIARAHRAHTARLLLENTTLPITDVAFAAGFGSVRQFNDTVVATFGTSASTLRRSRRSSAPTADAITVRLPFRQPYDVDQTWRYLRDRAVPGLEEMTPPTAADPATSAPTYRRALALPHGSAVIALRSTAGGFTCRLSLTDIRDLGAAVARCRRLLHLDADPAGMTEALGTDEVLGPLVMARPGLRVPGTIDPFETTIRAIIGQQISLRAARTVTADLVARYGTPLTEPTATLTHTFPTPDWLRAAEALPMPGSRERTLTRVAATVADHTVTLDPGADRAATLAALAGVPGVGPWTIQYVALRALGDPDAFPAGDLGIRRALSAYGITDDQPTITRLADRWRPLRAYAAQHLWTSLFDHTSPTAKAASCEPAPYSTPPPARCSSKPRTAATRSPR